MLTSNLSDERCCQGLYLLGSRFPVRNHYLGKNSKHFVSELVRVLLISLCQQHSLKKREMGRKKGEGDGKGLGGEEVGYLLRLVNILDG